MCHLCYERAQPVAWPAGARRDPQGPRGHLEKVRLAEACRIGWGHKLSACCAGPGLGGRAGRGSAHFAPAPSQQRGALDSHMRPFPPGEVDHPPRWGLQGSLRRCQPSCVQDLLEDSPEREAALVPPG